MWPFKTDFFTQHNALEITQVVACINGSFLLLLRSIPWYGHIGLFNPSPTKGHFHGFGGASKYFGFIQRQTYLADKTFSGLTILQSVHTERKREIS